MRVVSMAAMATEQVEATAAMMLERAGAKAVDALLLEELDTAEPKDLAWWYQYERYLRRRQC